MIRIRHWLKSGAQVDADYVVDCEAPILDEIIREFRARGCVTYHPADGESIMIHYASVEGIARFHLEVSP